MKSSSGHNRCIFGWVRSGIIAALGLFVLSTMSAASDLPSFDLEMRDGQLIPQRIEVEAGTTFKIIVRNTGTMPAEFESLRLRKEKVLSPGATSFVVIRKLSPGSYEFFDEFHLDKESAHGLIVAR
ncbi:cupredoxin domain-containing protein [Kiloniella laminariae]|uniref:Cupredoxin domain-containing protein n=2 Tax=Kiloniella laminariae TaxID=454162 RepID=A0ABT4LPA0_9PROT|nr:cupredoxin domain-containing protein [Kiloniella laminariae]MCZ4282949.1 cupredoxin domain-containing protein [Kiloniella laminariae]